MYESPIELIIGDYIKDVANKIVEERNNQIENEIYCTINTKYGISINKEELMRALAYDRDQYNIGYLDGKRDAEAKQENSRKFIEIMVSYPPEELCTYPEYKGKPYFSIHYEEDGQNFVGYGTYKPDVLSRYLRDYFFNKEETDGSD